MKPKQIAEELSDILNRQSPAMTYLEIETRLKLPPGEMKRVFRNVRDHLERDHTPVMRATEFYFQLAREPKVEEEAKLCCALHGRASVGIRLIWNNRNDFLGRTWVRLNGVTAQGIQSCNMDRVAVGHDLRKLSKGKGRKLVNEAIQPKLPFHESEFKTLMGKRNGELENGEE